VVIETRLDYGMTDRTALPGLVVSLKTGEKKAATIPLRAPPDAWGVRAHVRLLQDTVVVAQASDVFAVGTDNYRLGQDSSCWSQDFSPDRTADFSERPGVWPASRPETPPHHQKTSRSHGIGGHHVAESVVILSRNRGSPWPEIRTSIKETANESKTLQVNVRLDL
jgi:hypothetical protein